MLRPIFTPIVPSTLPFVLISTELWTEVGFVCVECLSFDYWCCYQLYAYASPAAKTVMKFWQLTITWWLDFDIYHIAKVCFAHCSTSRLALGSRGCWVVVTMPKISLKTLYCYIFEKPKVQGHQNWYSQLSNTQIQIHKYSFVEVPGIPNICYISKQLLIQGCQKWYSQASKEIRSDIQSNIRSDI